MYVVNVHSNIITPSGSVLLGKTMEASCTVGSFPCQDSQISLTDIPVWDEVWEQTTSRHLCSSWRVAHSKFSDSTEWSIGNPFLQGLHRSHNYLSQQVGVRSCKTTQSGSVNRPSVVPHGLPRVLGPTESLQFSLIAVSVCRHDLPPHTFQWSHSLGVAKGWLEASPWSLYFPHWLGHCTQVPVMNTACTVRVGSIASISWLLTYWE